MTNLVDARAELDPLTNGPQVTSSSTGPAAASSVSAPVAIGDYMAIVLDDRVMSAAGHPERASARAGRSRWAGNTCRTAPDLALVLRAGALPVPLKIVEARTVGPSLGEDSIKQGLLAGAIGIVLVILIMIGYYRFSGVLAVAALALYLLVYAGDRWPCCDATLTLPGLAGSCSRSAWRSTPTC